MKITKIWHDFFLWIISLCDLCLVLGHWVKKTLAEGLIIKIGHISKDNICIKTMLRNVWLSHITISILKDDCIDRKEYAQDYHPDYRVSKKPDVFLCAY